MLITRSCLRRCADPLLARCQCLARLAAARLSVVHQMPVRSQVGVWLLGPATRWPTWGYMPVDVSPLAPTAEPWPTAACPEANMR